jgi:hypothetical protein
MIGLLKKLMFLSIPFMLDFDQWTDRSAADRGAADRSAADSGTGVQMDVFHALCHNGFVVE